MEILRKIYAFFIDTIQTLLLAASVFLVIYIFIMRPFQVSGESMYPTFKDHEYILTNLIGLRLADPVHGDVIVFRAPTDRDKDFIKRVIGNEGDTVMVQGGKVFVNSQLLDESEYLAETVYTSGGAFLSEGETITVPPDNFFVMGDNRPASSDSREWGFLKKTDIVGKSFFVYWPLTKMRIVENPFKE